MASILARHGAGVFRVEQAQRDQVEAALDELYSSILDLAMDPRPPFAVSKRVGKARARVLELAAPDEPRGRRICDGAYCAGDAGCSPHTLSAVRR
jgi:hypothetical protein